MKKIFLSSLLSLCLISITGCSKITTTIAKHEHEFNQQIQNENTLKEAATCKSGSTYYYSCSCGATNDETFVANDKLDHTLTNEFYTSDETPMVITVIDGEVAVFFKCSKCLEYERIDYNKEVGKHTHIAHEYIDNKGTCAICNTEFNKE